MFRRIVCIVKTDNLLVLSLKIVDKASIMVEFCSIELKHILMTAPFELFCVCISLNLTSDNPTVEFKYTPIKYLLSASNPERKRSVKMLTLPIELIVALVLLYTTPVVIF